MKIKISKERLIVALKKKRQQEFEKYSNEQAMFSDKESSARARYLQNLTVYMKEVEQGGEILTDKYELASRLHEGVDFPSEPKEPKLEKYDSLLERLSLVEGETIEMTEKDEYLALI